MSNKLTDLNEQLFVQLKRLNTSNLKDTKLIEEIERSKAVCKISKQMWTKTILILPTSS